jgi:tetratricopeptide (TPR) repeat protein
MAKKSKKPKAGPKRISSGDSPQGKGRTMASERHIDPIKLGRKAFVEVVDQVAVFQKTNNVDLNKKVGMESSRFFREGDPQGFLDWLESAVPDWRTRADNEGIFYVVGMAHKYCGNFEEAARFYRKALAMMEKKGNLLKVSGALQELSVCVLATSGDHAEAWRYLNRAIEIVPDASNWPAYYNRVALASSECDDRRLKSTIKEFVENVPLWFKDDKIVHLFKTDSELEYLRGKAELWTKIHNKIEGK